MNWQKYKLGELCKIEIGKTPSRGISRYWGPGYPFLSIADMNQGVYLSTTRETITTDAVKEANCKLVPLDTLLLSFKLSVGKLGFTKVPLYTNEAIAALYIREAITIEKRFLYWALRTIDLLKYSNKAAKGATLNKPKLNNIEIFLPPLDEQIRLTAILDKAEILCNTRQRTLFHLKTLPTNIFYEMFGDPIDNLMNWELKTFEDLAKKQKHAIKRGPFGGALKKDIFVKNGFKVYEQQHAINKDFSLGHYYIDDKKFKEMKAFIVEPGDFIISCSGTLGRIARMPENAEAGIINQALLKISIDNSIVNSIYFEALFETESIQRELFNVSRGTGLKNFPPMDVLRKFKFPVPPLEEQNRYASIVEKIIMTKQKTVNSLSRIELLFLSIQAKAFGGEL